MYATYNNTDPFAPCHDHGTSVAVIAAGTTYGVAKEATINVARVSDDCVGGGVSSGAAVNALNFIADYSPRPAVANASFSTHCPWWDIFCGISMDNAVAYAIASGVPVIVSAGNHGADACDYSPARVSQAITVGASDIGDNRAIFSSDRSSNYGSCLDIFAPGRDLGIGHTTFGQTSGAAPFVAGVAAMHVKFYPASSAKSAILNAATANVLSGIGAGSPNRLLHSYFPGRVTIHGPTTVHPQVYCTWTSTVTGLHTPYIYEWRRNGQIVSSGGSYTTTDTGAADFDLELTVTGSEGRVGFDLIRVEVAGTGSPIICV